MSKPIDEAMELNDTHTVQYKGIWYAPGHLRMLRSLTPGQPGYEPPHTNPNKFRNKRERNNRRKARKK